MDVPSPLPPDILAALPPAVVALIQWQAAHIDRLTAQIDRLTARVAELEARAGKDSTNSSKPPSTEHPHAKPVRPAPKSKRSRGSQPGHKKHELELIPTADCQAVVPCVPAAGRRCGRPLGGTDPAPLRHQVWELPEIRPVVTKYQRHRLACRCGVETCGALPAGVPAGQAGPRLPTVPPNESAKANYRGA